MKNADILSQLLIEINFCPHEEIRSISFNPKYYYLSSFPVFDGFNVLEDETVLTYRINYV